MSGAMTENRETAALPIMPLSMALVGQMVTFVGVEGNGITHRLAELGLTPGMRFEVVNRGPGAFIIEVRGMRLVLGQGMVGRIQVRTVME
jgi:Fe2+ transport system protein FeoA